MEQKTVKTMTNEQLIGACVWLDREQKKSRAMMNSYKAELQARGLAIMEDHNVKYVKFYGDEGSAAITDSMSLDILNPDKLKELVGEGVYKMKVKEETKTTYKFDSKFEKAMKAIFTGDYTFETTLEEFLDEMSIKPDDKQKKLLLKKLKGEFEKDKETLMDAGEMSFDDVRCAYASWKGGVSHYDSYNVVKSMDKLFDELFIHPFIGGGHRDEQNNNEQK